MSPQAVGPPPAHASTLDTVGAVLAMHSAHTASHSPSRTRNGRVGVTGSGLWLMRARGGVDGGLKRCAYLAGMAMPGWPEWSMPGAGVGSFTGTVSSILVSWPLASLSISVSGTLLPFSRGCFKSMSMTW